MASVFSSFRVFLSGRQDSRGIFSDDKSGDIDWRTRDTAGALHDSRIRMCGLVFGFRPAAAQESRGSIAGLVVDSSGGACPASQSLSSTTVRTRRSCRRPTSAGQYTAGPPAAGDVQRDGRAERLSEARISEHAGARRRASATRRDARRLRASPSPCSSSARARSSKRAARPSAR